jgi:hypothetical protein
MMEVVIVIESRREALGEVGVNGLLGWAWRDIPSPDDIQITATKIASLLSNLGRFLFFAPRHSLDLSQHAGIAQRSCQVWAHPVQSTCVSRSEAPRTFKLVYSANRSCAVASSG